MLPTFKKDNISEQFSHKDTKSQRKDTNFKTIYEWEEFIAKKIR